MNDWNGIGTLSFGIAIGVIIPFAVLFGVAGGFAAFRAIKKAIIYARPAHLERRIHLAGRFVGARRAYFIGRGRLAVALIVGDDYSRTSQAADVLHDHFLLDKEPDHAD